MNTWKSHMRKIFSQFFQWCGEKIRTSYLSVVSFIKKYHDTLLAILIPVIVILFALPVSIFFVKVDSYRLFFYLLYVVGCTVLFYLFFLKRIFGWFRKHSAFVNLCAILIAVLLFAWQQAREDKNKQVEAQSRFFENEVSLKEENNRNNSHLESIWKDLPRDDDTMFWRDFSTRSYVELWDYIHLYKSQECKNAYAALTINLGALNNLNKARREVVVEPESHFLFKSQFDKKLVEAASSTQPVLDFVVGNCQTF